MRTPSSFVAFSPTPPIPIRGVPIRGVPFWAVAAWAITMGLPLFSSGNPVQAQCLELESVIQAGDRIGNDRFGLAMIESQTHLLIASRGANGLVNRTGAVYAFARIGEHWVEQQKIFASDGEPFDRFGWSLDVDGDELLIGAREADGFLGAAYFFSLVGSSWVETQRIVASSRRSFATFGEAVVIEDDWALVGTPDNAAGAVGSFFAFAKENNTWVEIEEVSTTNASPYAEFGAEMVMEQGRLLVGAPGYETHVGTVFFFEHDGNGWVEKQKIVAPDADNGKRFGTSLSIDGDWLAIGSPGGPQGAAYLYQFDGNQWVFVDQVSPEDQERSEFGMSVSIRDERLVVGLPRYTCDTDTSLFCGQARVYVRRGSEWNEVQAYTREIEYEELGTTVLDLGDRVITATDDGPSWDYEDEPATWSNYGTGFPGTLGVPEISMDREPQLGTDVSIFLGNSLGTTTTGVLFVGTESSDAPGSWGGALLVVPSRIIPMALPGSGLQFPVELPSADAFCGMDVFLQAVQLDDGAAYGISSSEGLRMHLGG